jgi:hypothetical protein
MLVVARTLPSERHIFGHSADFLEPLSQPYLRVIRDS